jgi:BlaI family transcriptional regulator, penicillinase repressor
MAVFTDRELDIMSILWQRGDATAAQVRDALAADGVELAYNTVLSMLRILQDKGHVSYAVEGRAHRYRPLVQREEAGRSAVRRLLTGIFDRSPELLLTQLLRDEPMDRATLERLRAMVETELASASAADAASATTRARRRSI